MYIKKKSLMFSELKAAKEEVYVHMEKPKKIIDAEILP